MGSFNRASISQAHLRVPGVDVEIELSPGSMRPARLRGVDLVSEPGSAPRLRLSLDFPPPSMESDEADYDDYELTVPRRRRSIALACLIGIALGVGALQFPQVRSLGERAATAWKHRSVPARVIQDVPESSDVSEVADRWQSVP